MSHRRCFEPTTFPAYGIYIGEVIASVLLILGLLARLGAVIIAINMVVALALVHLNQLISLADTGGWALELQDMYLGTAVAITLFDAGRFSVAGSNGRWN